MKKLINSPTLVIDQMLDGLLVLDPGLARLENHNVLLRRDWYQYREV